MRRLILGLTTACLAAVSAIAADKPENAEREEALAKLAPFIGGVWTNNKPDFPIEFRYEWAFDKSAIRGLGVIGKGKPNETKVESTLGWDPERKTIYYLDNHGGSSVYSGTIRFENGEMHFEFETLIGKPAKWQSVAKFSDANTYQFAILGLKDGQWAPVVQSELKRRQPAAEADDPSRQVTEGIIDAPVDAVWAALTTKEGQESWNVARAEIDLKVGGKMLTHYSADGRIGDPNTIESIILSFEPKRMFSIKVGKPPEKFPFKEAVKNVWHVMTFEEAGPGKTHLRLVGLGYGADDDSKKLRKFFEVGNAYTLRKLQEHFKSKSANPSK